MSATIVTPAPGWFGKLPALGDFASRRLPEDFVRRWDDWLRAGLLCAREDPDWLARYLVAPIRRFWLAPGVVDGTGRAGLLMPSVDRVGRHFPLTLAQPLDTLAQALAARGWFAALDAAARRVLDLDYTVEAFERSLAAVEAPHAGILDASARRLAGELGAGSVWWCDDSETPSGFQCHAGLPPPRALAAMLGGRP
jgi:type VI secretion system protein ImpM